MKVKFPLPSIAGLPDAVKGLFPVPVLSLVTVKVKVSELSLEAAFVAVCAPDTGTAKLLIVIALPAPASSSLSTILESLAANAPDATFGASFTGLTVIVLEIHPR